jgi:hypothetical protein
MPSLQQTDLIYCLTRLPKDLRGVIIKHGLIIAGGYIRSMIAHEDVSDIDIFGPSVEVLYKAADDLVAERKTTNPDIRKVVTQNAITVFDSAHKPVQFITRWLYNHAIQVHRSFDFSICMAAIQYGVNTQCWQSVVHDRFYSDLAAKRLFYTNPDRNEDAGGSMLRVMKYVNRGYHIAPESLCMVINRLMKGIDNDTWHKASDYDRVELIRLKLREVDPAVYLPGVGQFDEHEQVPVVPQ